MKKGTCSTTDRQTIQRYLLGICTGRRAVCSPDHLPMLIANAFALACYLHADGDPVQRRAAIKMISTVFAAVGGDHAITAQRLIRYWLDGNEADLAGWVGAHAEIKKLFQGMPHGD